MIKFPAMLLVLLAAVPLFHCGGDLPSTHLPPSISWENRQSVIRAADGVKNSWSGFDVTNDLFVANKNISKFILWRDRRENQTITLRYFLKGALVTIFINSKETFKLPPRNKTAEFTADIPLLKGFNFIEFRKSDASVLKIETLTVGDQPADSHHLETGNGFSRFHAPGSGQLALTGSGKVRIRVVQFAGGREKIQEHVLEPGFLSRRISFPFHFQFPGFIQASTLSGAFDIAGYTQLKEVKGKEETNETAANSWQPLIKQFTQEKPGVYIFLIDGCRAGHLGVYGYSRDTSPNIDRLARDSVIFDNAYANATFTRSSVASIFTGFHPHRHKLRILTNRLPKGLFMLPEFMREKGYKTALLTEAGNISRFFGFGQGVDRYKKVFRRWDDPRYLENNMYRFFCDWLTNEGPLFTYVHYRAPHFPIIPPPPFLDMYKEGKPKGGKPKKDRLIFNLVALGEQGRRFYPAEIKDVTDDYDSTIRYVDAEVGKLIDKLKAEGRYESSLIIFTSDHGEALYEHGFWGHGHNVYPGTARVPLIVKFPAGMELTGRVERVTELVDIFPTLAGLLGEKRYFDGQSLLDSVNSREEDDRIGFSTTFGMPPSISMRWRSWYYVIHLFSGEQELFNLREDPLTNVAHREENKDVLTFFRTRFLDWYITFDNLERTSQSVDLKKLPRDEYENLKSLGYIK
jgi:arylsulfatase A-like enzyme